MGVNSGSTWNYRIIKRAVGYSDKLPQLYEYQLVEAYYTGGKLDGYTSEPTTFTGDTALEVIESLLNAANNALQNNVFDEDCNDIENMFGGKPRVREK